MELWEKKLRDEIEEEMDMYDNPHLVTPNNNNFANNTRVVLVATVILLAFITAGAFFLKKDKNGSNVTPYGHVYSNSYKRSSTPQYTLADRVVNLDNKVARMHADLRANDKQTIVNRDRIWLMAIVNNENAYIRKHNTGEDYLIIGNDWKLDRMPRYINLSYEQKERLQRYCSSP